MAPPPEPCACGGLAALSLTTAAPAAGLAVPSPHDLGTCGGLAAPSLNPCACGGLPVRPPRPWRLPRAYRSRLTQQSELRGGAWGGLANEARAGGWRRRIGRRLFGVVGGHGLGCGWGPG